MNNQSPGFLSGGPLSRTGSLPWTSKAWLRASLLDHHGKAPLSCVSVSFVVCPTDLALEVLCIFSRVPRIHAALFAGSRLGGLFIGFCL